MIGIKHVSALAVAIAMCATATSAVAAEEMEARKHKNAMYATMTLVDYKAGMSGKAYGLIKDHFMPAGKAAGTPGPWTMHLQTGEWDAVFFWEMKDGPVGFEWSDSPNDVKWMKALIKQEGSEEAAMKIIKDYQSTIARSNTMFGHHHKTEEEMEKEDK